MIALQAEVWNHGVAHRTPRVNQCIEAQVEAGRGPLATVIVQEWDTKTWRRFSASLVFQRQK